MKTKASQIDCHLKVGKVLLLAVKCYSVSSYNPTFTFYSRRMADKSAGKYNPSTVTFDVDCRSGIEGVLKRFRNAGLRFASKYFIYVLMLYLFFFRHLPWILFVLHILHYSLVEFTKDNLSHFRSYSFVFQGTKRNDWFLLIWSILGLHLLNSSQLKVI